MQESDGLIDDPDDNLEYELWEDDGDPDNNEAQSAQLEEEYAPPLKKKKRGASLFLIITLIALACLGYYYIKYHMNTEQVMPPIVSLGASTELNVPAASEKIAPLPNDLADAVSVEAKKGTQRKEKDVVLTPLPDAILDSDINLPSLEAEIEPDAVMPFENEATEAVSNTTQYNISDNEQKIISKTEETLAIEATPENNSALLVEARPEKKTHVQNNLTDSPTVSVPEETTQKIQDSTILDKAKAEKTITKTEKSIIVPKETSVSLNKPVWKIKGASPQRAVIYNKESGETRSVEPGNNVKGLGRIKSIRKENGKWVVIGTSGRAKQ